MAEDHPVSQRVAVAMLENLGFDVDVVSNGAEAVKAATRTAYHAILMDCQMPVLDGYQATGEIRHLERGSAHTPIIAVTASAMQSDQQGCLAAGMDDYLTKPWSLEAMAAVLERWAPDESVPADGVRSAELLPAAEADPAPQVDRAGPLLDTEVVDRLTRLGGQVGLIGQLATLFVPEAAARLVELRQALAADDAETVIRSAHALRGAGASLGATGLSRLCETLETDAAAGDLVGGEALLETIEAEVERVRFALGSATLTP